MTDNNKDVSNERIYCKNRVLVKKVTQKEIDDAVRGVLESNDSTSTVVHFHAGVFIRDVTDSGREYAILLIRKRVRHSKESSSQ